MRILVVEDEKDLNNIITKHLKKNNFSVDSVFNGEEALEYLDYGTYDLIVLDIMLPKVNGYEVIKKLRENLFFLHLQGYKIKNSFNESFKKAINMEKIF